LGTYLNHLSTFICMRLVFTALIFYSLSTLCFSQTVRDNMNEIDYTLKDLVDNSKTPSVQYVIFSKDSILHRFKYGYADVQKKQETTDKTTYKAYSVTKTFTALAILQLAEKNLLDIEKPAKNYLPDFPYSSDITIKQLLTHSAGVPNPIPLDWIHLVTEHNTFNRNVFFSKILKRYKKTKSKPNEKFAYSNLGYVLLGQIIEIVSGVSYEEFICTHILDPLKLQPKDLDFTMSSSENHAKGYHKKWSFTNFLLRLFIDKSTYMEKVDGTWNGFKDIYVNGASYGGLIGTPDSFVIYVQELIKPNSTLISAESKKLLFTENRTIKNKATGMCLSWFTGNLNGNRYLTNAGGGGGYYCEIRIYPELELGSVIMFNRTGMSDERYLDEIDKYIVTQK